MRKWEYETFDYSPLYEGTFTEWLEDKDMEGWEVVMHVVSTTSTYLFKRKIKR